LETGRFSMQQGTSSSLINVSALSKGWIIAIVLHRIIGSRVSNGFLSGRMSCATTEMMWGLFAVSDRPLRSSRSINAAPPLFRGDRHRKAANCGDNRAIPVLLSREAFLPHLSNCTKPGELLCRWNGGIVRIDGWKIDGNKSTLF
jgi:hypothetical protein